jgi:hypothetical protein
MIYRLINDMVRSKAASAVLLAPTGHTVEIREPRRNEDQSALFHAICTDLANSQLLWMGLPRTKDDWKVLLISGHAVATGEGASVIPGIEGEFVNIRESTSTMGKARMTSLVEYSFAFATQHGVEVKLPYQVEA